MPRSATTGVFTRVSNSFSNPVFGTLIDPTDADTYFDDLDVGLNPPELDGPVRFINSLQVGTTGTAAGTVEFFNATSGSITLSPTTGALGSAALILPAAVDTLVGRNTTDVLNNKSMNGPVINGGLISALTGFSLRDTSAAFNLTFTATSSPVLSGNRFIVFDVQNGNRIITLGDNIAFAGVFTQAGAFSTTITSTAPTSVTLPTSGTLATLAGSETFTNKTLTAPVMTAPVLGTPASGVATNLTGTAAGLTAGTFTAGSATNLTSGTLSNARLGWNTFILSANPANPTGTTSATQVMAGIGGVCSFTPSASTRAYIRITGNAANTNATNNTVAQARFGTGGAPANGAAATGTTIGAAITATSATANAFVPFAVGGIITGLSVGVAIWIDLGFLAGANTSTLTNITCVAYEI